MADTKLEFGTDSDGALVLADEVLTPDSSRYWPADEYQPGHPQYSYDKQFLRDWSTAMGWDRKEPARRSRPTWSPTWPSATRRYTRRSPAPDRPGRAASGTPGAKPRDLRIKLVAFK